MSALYQPMPIFCPRCEVQVYEILPPAVSYKTMGLAQDALIDHYRADHGGQPGLVESLNLFQDVKEQCGLGGM